MPDEDESAAPTFARDGFAGFVLSYGVGGYSESPNPLVEFA